MHFIHDTEIKLHVYFTKFDHAEYDFKPNKLMCWIELHKPSLNSSVSKNLKLEMYMKLIYI